MVLVASAAAQAAGALDAGLYPPQVGQHELRVLAPNLLELILITTKQPGGTVTGWDWVDNNGNFVPPNTSGLTVTINGRSTGIAGVGYKRRPIYAPLLSWDLRIATYLYLRLGDVVADGETVRVESNGAIWPSSLVFTAMADPLRYNPALHVNQEGYLPGHPKKAMVGYFAGSLGELAIPTNRFFLVNATGGTVFQGTLTLRQDRGFNYSPLPYQSVWEADFSSFNQPGEYRLMVPRMGASMPFRIDDGAGMNVARAWALGMFHQRSGFNVAMPFTRFTHAPDHMAPVSIPTNASPPFEFTWATIADYASQVNSDNPPQTAPRLLTPSAQLYPFVTNGPVDVAGGHFEAANYSKVPWNNAQIIHILMFAVDVFSGVAALDNLGVAESGDGISDVLQEAKWEADCLVKMQDLDGGFYYMIHPLHREYEGDVLPEDGDPQVAWPKNTAATASAVAALVQCASSPVFKQAYPAAASNYWNKALLGWKFLTNAIATHEFSGAYQRIMHFGDAFTHQDDLAWAACELFLATRDVQFQNKLEEWLPDPTSPDTARWGWWKMYAAYGNAIRSYAAGVKSGRVQAGHMDSAYLAKCMQAINDCANANLWWSQDNAYGSSFPDQTKRTRSAGWYYSSEQAFDIVVAQEFSPNPDYLDAILRNVNYELGCNPVNASYVTGMGLKRQLQVVDQYSANDRRELPKIGVPIGNIQGGFVYTWTYNIELSKLCSPADGAEESAYPFYDRWSDTWNVSTEASTPNTVRCFATALWLAARTPAASRGWTWTNASIATPTVSSAGRPVTVTLNVADPNLTGARIIWEAQGQNPKFGGLSHSFTPLQQGTRWVEAEVQWPDGRRAFAMNNINVGPQNPDAPPELNNPLRLPDGNFKFNVLGNPQQSYIIQSSSTLSGWIPLSTNVLPETGILEYTDTQATGAPRRYYRVLKAP